MWVKTIPVSAGTGPYKFTATSGLPACVCVLCRLHICTCVFQCVVCAIKNLTKVLIIINYYYTLVSPSRRQEGEKTVAGMTRVRNDPLGLPPAALAVKVLNGWQCSP